MGRPTDTNSSETYARILESARTIVERDGMEALSFRQTARAAGVGLGTVRYHFETQEALLEACLDLYHEGLVDLQRVLGAEVISAASPQEAIPSCIGLVFDFLEKNTEFARMRTIITTQQGGPSKARHAHFRGPFLDVVSTALRSIPGNSGRDMRLVADAANRLISSYAVCSEQDACEVTGLSDPKEARYRLREFASEVCLQLVFG